MNRVSPNQIQEFRKELGHRGGTQYATHRGRTQYATIATRYQKCFFGALPANSFSSFLSWMRSDCFVCNTLSTQANEEPPFAPSCLSKTKFMNLHKFVPTLNRALIVTLHNLTEP